VTGETGLQEAIKRGALKKVVENARIGEEAQAVEEFFEELEKDGNVDYGEAVEELAEKLEAIGVEGVSSYQHRVNGTIPIEKIPQAAKINTARSFRSPQGTTD